MEPQVSDPIAKPASPAATAAPEPLDEPPAQRLRSHGLCVAPAADALPNLYPVPPASSIMLSFPRRTAPASRKRATTVASYSKTWFANSFDPHRVGMPLVVGGYRGKALDLPHDVVAEVADETAVQRRQVRAAR